MAFDSTIGSESANSYASVAEADLYFADAFGRPLWNDQLATKESLLVTSSRYLDTYMVWKGQKAATAQALEWPRTGAYDRSGREYANDTIPVAVKFAVYELAYYILQNDGLSFEEQSLDSVKVGSIAINFTDRSVDSGIPKYIESIVSHIGSTNLPSANSVRLVELERV